MGVGERERNRKLLPVNPVIAMREERQEVGWIVSAKSVREKSAQICSTGRSVSGEKK